MKILMIFKLNTKKIANKNKYKWLAQQRNLKQNQWQNLNQNQNQEADLEPLQKKKQVLRSLYRKDRNLDQ